MSYDGRKRLLELLNWVETNRLKEEISDSFKFFGWYIHSSSPINCVKDPIGFENQGTHTRVHLRKDGIRKMVYSDSESVFNNGRWIMYLLVELEKVKTRFERRQKAQSRLEEMHRVTDLKRRTEDFDDSLYFEEW